MSRATDLLREATPLPWKVSDGRNNSESLTIANDHEQSVVHDYCHGCGGINNDADAALIVYAVNALPAYEAAVEALERFVESHEAGYPASIVLSEEACDAARAALRRLRESVPA